MDVDEVPLIVVYDEQQTYYELSEQMQKDLNKIMKSEKKPQSLEQRAVVDITTAVLLFVFTFLACDLVRAAKTGLWTPIYWLWWGPWEWITRGHTPIFTKLVDWFGHSRPTPAACETMNNTFEALCGTASWRGLGFESQQACYDWADEVYDDCFALATEEAPLGRPVGSAFRHRHPNADDPVGNDRILRECLDTAQDQYDDCVYAGGGKQCRDIYNEAQDACNDAYVGRDGAQTNCIQNAATALANCTKSANTVAEQRQCLDTYNNAINNCSYDYGSGPKIY